MTDYVECPDEYGGDGPSLFLAGGITGCPNWQQEMRSLLDGNGLTLLNPRRTGVTEIDWADDVLSHAQVDWEFRHLRKASEILFWFPKESICPIALYELGAWSMTPVPLFIGTHPDYPRRRDIEIQTALVRPDLIVHDTMSSLANAIVAHYCSDNTRRRPVGPVPRVRGPLGVTA